MKNKTDKPIQNPCCSFVGSHRVDCPNYETPKQSECICPECFCGMEGHNNTDPKCPVHGLKVVHGLASQPEETAHSGLIDTPTAQKEQKVVESKVSECNCFCHDVYQRCKHCFGYKRSEFISKKELAEKLKYEKYKYYKKTNPPFSLSKETIATRNQLRKELKAKFNL